MSFPSSPDASTLEAPAALAIHLDLVGGIAGDMFVAAMVDALPALEQPVLAAVAAVRPGDAVLPSFPVGTSAGLRARRFGAEPAAPGTYRATDAAPRTLASAPHGTAYVELRRRIEDAPLPEATRRHALALLLLLAAAEAQVHGTSVEEVHFHELADWDSLMDVVAAGCIAATLEGADFTASALPVGGGRIRGAHGTLPIPAPATSALLAGYRWQDDGIAGERVTPTGAAILRHLVAPAKCGGAPATGRLRAIGSGAGTRALPGVPNIVRALVFEREQVPAGSGFDGDFVAVLEFDVDDMTGEEIALAAERLRTRAGVVDVTLATRLGKKGRPATDFRVLVQPYAAFALAQACFSETSTLGVRIGEHRRHVLRRREVETTHGEATIGVKLSQRPGGEVTAKAAHDDLAQSEGLAARRAIGAAAAQRALEGGEE